MGDEEGRGIVLEVLCAKKVEKGEEVRSKLLSADVLSSDLSVNRPLHVPTEIVDDIDKMRGNPELLGVLRPIVQVLLRRFISCSST